MLRERVWGSISEIFWSTVVRLSANFSSIFSSRNTEPISTKLGTKHPWVKGFKFDQRKGPALSMGDKYEIAKIHWRNKKKLFSRTNFNRTWLKASLGEGDSIFFKWRELPFSKGNNYEIAKNINEIKKNLLLQNHWVNFNQTWHKASLGEGD